MFLLGFLFGSWQPGGLFWDFLAGAGLFGLLGGITTFSPGLILAGVLLLVLSCAR